MKVYNLWMKHWSIERSVYSCMSESVCVLECIRTLVYVCASATEGSGAAVCTTGWQGGCENGPVSCVSSKIGPNTAEMHDALRLFTALTQCVCAGCCQVRGTRRTLRCTVSVHRLQKDEKHKTGDARKVRII